MEQQRDAEKEQIARLQGSSTVSNLDGGATQFAALAAHHNAIQAQKAVENFEEQIRCLRDGVQVGPGDGRNDLPYSTQRLHEISLRIEEVRSALRRTRRSWPNSSGTCGWKSGSPVVPGSRPPRRPKRSFGRRASGDAPIKADDPLLDVIRPSEVFIDAVIYERDLSRVKPGDRARVRLPGSGREWKAVVKQVFGRSLPWPDELLATQPAPASKEEIHVLLSFDEPLGDGADAVGWLPLQGLPARGDFCFHGRCGANGLFAGWPCRGQQALTDNLALGINLAVLGFFLGVVPLLAEAAHMGDGRW